LLLLAAAASAQDHAELRKFIDSFRSERERANVELVLPKQVPPLPQRAWLTREFTSGATASRYGVLWIDSVAGGKVRVVRIQAGDGEATQGAIITRAQWDALARDLLLIREAKLRRVKGEPRSDRWKGTAKDGQVRLELLTGDGLTVLADGPDVTPGLAPEGELDAFGAWERNALWSARIRKALSGWKLKPRPVSNAAAARLLRELEAVGKRRTGQFAAYLLRLEVLGGIGYEPALPTIKELQARGGTIGDAAGLARRKIEILNAADPKQTLLSALFEQEVGDWAKAEALRRYPAEYAAALLRQFDQASELAKLEALNASVGGDDLAIPLHALDDASLKIRLNAAITIMGRHPKVYDTLFAVARDRSLRTLSDISYREVAIRILGQYVTPEDAPRVRAALVSLLVANDEDAGIRRVAAVALSGMGGKPVIDELRKQLRQPPIAKPVYLHEGGSRNAEPYERGDELRGAIAEALADIGATDAVPELVALLAPERKEGEREFRWRIGRALANLGDPAAKATLEKERDRATEVDHKNWDELIALLAKFGVEDDGKTLLDTLGSTWASDVAIFTHLARRFDEDQLKKLQEKYPEYRSEIALVLSRK